MRNFVAGRKFRFETALAALAALCESHFAPFAEELLIDLAALKLREIGHAIRVARACLQNRTKLPKTGSKTYIVSSGRWRARADFGEVDSSWNAKPPIQVQAYALA